MRRLTPWLFFFSSRRRHTRSLCDWSSDVCSSDLGGQGPRPHAEWLGHVVVAPEREAVDLVLRRVAGGEEDDRNPLAIAAQAPEHLERSEERRLGKEGRSRWSPYH